MMSLLASSNSLGTMPSTIMEMCFSLTGMNNTDRRFLPARRPGMPFFEPICSTLLPGCGRRLAGPPGHARTCPAFCPQLPRQAVRSRKTRSEWNTSPRDIAHRLQASILSDAPAVWAMPNNQDMSQEQFMEAGSLAVGMVADCLNYIAVPARRIVCCGESGIDLRSKEIRRIGARWIEDW